MVFNVQESSERKSLDPEDLPHTITKLEDVAIPMKDGCKLMAHIWMPEEALNTNGKLATLIEYIPYRKNDFTAIRDSIRHPYFAGHGFASIRIDMRGCGDSDDVLLDEYSKQEHDDCLEAFDWVIKQPWSNGKLGMFGKSWGGFNALQLAARQHPALKTIITLMSTDDRYSDDVHYRGGALFASDMLWWSATMVAYVQRPQDPQIVGESWRENWLKRLKVPPTSIAWLSHQTRDEYWKHGSICENDYQDVRVPVLAVGGWRDGYTNPVFRMMDKLPNKESRAIIGPWVHEYPEVATPHPGMGFLQMAVQWWNKYLYPELESNIELPHVTAYIQDPSSLVDSYISRSGKWAGINYPVNKSFQLNLDASKRSLSSDSIKESSEVSFTGSLEHGLFRGTYCAFGQDGDFPTDQKIEDAKCITFDSAPFEEDWDLLGFPELNITVSSNQPEALLSARLMDIYPGGESILISWGMLNLTHRDSHEFPEVLVPGEKYKIQIALDSLGIKLEKGHSLRLSLSPTDWPSAWPFAETPTLTVYAPESYLTIPYVESSDYVEMEFPKPEAVRPCEVEVLRKEDRTRNVVYDVIGKTWTIDDFSDEGKRRLPSIGSANGIEVGSINNNKWFIKENEPLSAYNQCDWELTVGRDDWQTKVITSSNLRADAKNFYMYHKLTAFESEKKVHEQVWENTFPRNFC